MNTKHTPGLWRVEKLDGETIITIGEPAGHILAKINPLHEFSAETETAITRLIAAAPKLLEALRAAEISLVSFMESSAWEPGDEDAYQLVRAAIAKAEGKEQ